MAEQRLHLRFGAVQSDGEDDDVSAAQEHACGSLTDVFLTHTPVDEQTAHGADPCLVAVQSACGDDKPSTEAASAVMRDEQSVHDAEVLKQRSYCEHH